MGKTLCCKILGKRPTCASRDKRRKTKREREIEGMDNNVSGKCGNKTRVCVVQFCITPSLWSLFTKKPSTIHYKIHRNRHVAWYFRGCLKFATVH